MAESSIEWTDCTWNPVTGCTRASAGCDNCYAVTMTKRLEAMGQEKYSGLVNIGKNHFNGVVKCHDDALLIPLKWKKPRKVFVNSMSDLFHKDVPFEFIDKVFAVMALTPQHTYQVLTKRPERMAEYLNNGMFEPGSTSVLDQIEEIVEQAGGDVDRLYDAAHDRKTLRVYAIGDTGDYGCDIQMPLPNVWLGTSVENQAAADERIPHLLKCPAAVRFLSCEPLLGPVDLTRVDGNRSTCETTCMVNSLTGNHTDMGRPCAETGVVHWVIAGGESGPGHRPMDLTWVSSLKDQCESAGVPIFIKQLGGTFYHSGYRNGDDDIHAGPKGGDWEHHNFPDDLKIREFPEVAR